MIKDLSDNHLFNNYPCEAEDAKIESLRQQLAESENLRAGIEIGMDCANSEAVRLRQQLSESQKREVMLRDALDHANSILVESYDHVIHSVVKALAATEPKTETPTTGETA